MAKLEVLVATMNQKDLSKVTEINIRSDVIFANQTDAYAYTEEKIRDINAKMFSTSERGVGRNRNLALSMSLADICLLSDDDVVYVDDYTNIVIDAFNKLPQADIIIFNIETLGKEVSRRINFKIKRVGIFNFMNYGAVRIAFRREKIISKNIWFSLKFGGGATYGAGEDSLFLREALRKKLTIYTYPAKIAYVKQETSTWFQGYNKKYFFDKGAFCEAAFPKLRYLILVYYAWKYWKKSEYSFITILVLMMDGIKAFKRGIGYEAK